MPIFLHAHGAPSPTSHPSTCCGCVAVCLVLCVKQIMVTFRVCGLLALVALADGFVAPLRSSRTGTHGAGLQMGADDGSNNEEGSYLSWLAGKVDRARRPAFVNIARARLQRDFAVLLMRTSYQVCERNGPGIIERKK